MKAGISLLYVLWIHLSFLQVVSYAQLPPPGPPIYLRELFSTPFEPKSYAAIQGSPYIGEGWLLARLKVEGRKEIIDSLMIKLNAYENRIHFLNEKGVEMQTTLRVEEIKIIDSNSTLLNKVLLSGFEQEAGFFEVLTDGGKLKLLKRYRMDIMETHVLGAEVQRKFEQGSDLYFSVDRVLFHGSKNCSTLRDAFGNNEKLFSYISANNIRCNKEEDMRKLVEFYKTMK